MSLMRIGSGLAGGGLWRIAIPAQSVLQDRVLGVYSHSLWAHNYGTYAYNDIWLHRMAVADGGKTTEHSFTFNTIPGATPPSFNQNPPGVTVPGDSSTWTNTNANGYTDIVATIDNFNAPPLNASAETDPRLGGEIAYAGPTRLPVEHFVDVFSRWNAGTDNPDMKYWIYECWGDAGLVLNADGSGNASQFANWRGQTTDNHGYTQWYTDMLADVKEDLPAFADRIGILPVARVLVDVMENTAASVMTAGDWFEDDAPHGRDSTYLIAAAIVWSALYLEAAPQPSFTGASIHSSISSNWAAIASYINTQVNP